MKICQQLYTTQVPACSDILKTVLRQIHKRKIKKNLFGHHWETAQSQADKSAFIHISQTSIRDVKFDAEIIVRSPGIVWSCQYDATACFVLTNYTRHRGSWHYSIV